MKKTIALLLATVMLLGILCSCGNTAVKEETGEQINDGKVFEIAFKTTVCR